MQTQLTRRGLLGMLAAVAIAPPIPPPACCVITRSNEKSELLELGDVVRFEGIPGTYYVTADVRWLDPVTGGFAFRLDVLYRFSVVAPKMACRIAK